MTNINDIQRTLAETAPEYGVRSVLLFGSYARGDQTNESDVDLVVELMRPLGFKRAAFIQSLQDRLNLSVDVIFGVEQLYGPVREAYERDKVLIYEG